MKNYRKFNCLFQQKGETFKLFVNDAIRRGEDWDGNKSETSAAYFAEKLAEIPDGATLEVHINSEGGDAFEGTAIYNQLKAAPIHKIGIVDGRAFSAATFILMACDERIMNVGTTMLVHNAWTIAMGNADDLRAVADDLDKLMESNRNIFLEKCSLSEEELIALMKEEKMLTPKEALKYGFVDRIAEADEEDPEEEPEEKPEEEEADKAEETPEEEPDDENGEDEPEDEPAAGAPMQRTDRMIAAERFFKRFY